MSDDTPTGPGPRRRIPVAATPVPNEGPPTTTAPGSGGAADEEELRVTVYDGLGGQAFFDRLVDRFYGRVEADDVLLSLYPDQHDLGPARERLALFLAQYWGGPGTYSERRGHPRLRMRHGPFTIGEREKDHWLAAMGAALDETLPEAPLDEATTTELRVRMLEYFDMAATHLVNHPG